MITIDRNSHTFCAGISVALFGVRAAAGVLALVGLCGLLLLWIGMPETRLAKREAEEMAAADYSPVGN